MPNSPLKLQRGKRRRKPKKSVSNLKRRRDFSPKKRPKRRQQLTRKRRRKKPKRRPLKMKRIASRKSMLKN